MKPIEERESAAGAGWAGRVDKGRIVRIVATDVVSVVCFNAHDLTERFCQARTKVYNMRIWMSAGEQLFSKLNNPMMTMIADGFAPQGRHDLQLSPQLGLGALAAALAPWGIAEHSVPMPLNLFEHTEIDTRSGAIERAPIRPTAPTAIDLRAEIDLVVAVAVGSSQPARISILG